MTARESVVRAGPPQDADRIAPHRWTFAIAVAAVLVTFFPVGAVAVALTSIAEQTGVGTASLQWVTVAFVVPSAAVVLSAGVLGERHGLRPVLLAGLWLSGAGATAAATSSLLGPGAAIVVLWCGQAAAGTGAGLLLPTTLGLVVAAATDRAQRNRNLGRWISTSLLGLAVGPLLAGAILQAGPYGLIFVPTAVLSVVLAVLAARTLPRRVIASRRAPDWVGQGAVVAAVVATIAGAVEVGRSGWAPTGVVLLALGAVGAVGFVGHERRTAAPLLDLSLLRVPAFALAGTAAFGALFSGAGLLFLLGLFLGRVQELPPLQIGATLLFVTAVPAVLNPVAAALLTRVPALLLLCAGLALASTGAFLMVGLSADTPLADLAWRLVLFGVGFAALLTTVPAVVLDAVPPEQGAAAATFSTALRQVGGALGPAVLGAVLVAAERGGSDPTQAFRIAITPAGVLLGVLALAGFVVAFRATRPTTSRSAPGAPRRARPSRRSRP